AAEPLPLLSRLLEDAPGRVRRAVVDDDHLELARVALARGRLEEEGELARLVVDGRDDGEGRPGLELLGRLEELGVAGHAPVVLEGAARLERAELLGGAVDERAQAPERSGPLPGGALEERAVEALELLVLPAELLVLLRQLDEP